MCKLLQPLFLNAKTNNPLIICELSIFPLLRESLFIQFLQDSASCLALVYDGGRSITVLVEEIVVLVRLALLVIYRNRLEICLIVDFCHQVVIVIILNILTSL